MFTKFKDAQVQFFGGMCKFKDNIPGLDKITKLTLYHLDIDGTFTIGKHSDESLTYGIFLSEVREVLNYIRVMLVPLGKFIDKEKFPTRDPQTILIEIALYRRLGAPNEVNLKKLGKIIQHPTLRLATAGSANPKLVKAAGTQLDLDYNLKTSGNMASFEKKKKCQEPSNGIPTMHHIAVVEGYKTWFIGSSASVFETLTGGRELIKSIRIIEIGEPYIDLIQQSGMALEILDISRTKSDPNPRSIIGQIFKETDLGKTMNRSQNLGISLRGDVMTIALNCFRCEVMFQYQQAGLETFTQKARDDNTDNYKFKVDPQSLTEGEGEGEVEGEAHIKPQSKSTTKSKTKSKALIEAEKRKDERTKAKAAIMKEKMDAKEMVIKEKDLKHAGREHHACAEAVSSLQIIQAINERQNA